MSSTDLNPRFFAEKNSTKTHNTITLSIRPVTQQNVIVTNPDGLTTGSNPSMTLDIEVGAE